MSRHRNVRSLNYSDEYDGYDDVYGHSLEDDYSVSPGSAAFMYDRTRPTQVSAFLNTEEDIAEEDIEEDLDEEVPRPRNLNDLDEAKLRSCLDEARSVLGDSVPDQKLIDVILESDFDIAKTLDKVLNLEPSAKKQNIETPKPQRTPFLHHPTPASSNKDDFNPPAITVALTPSKPVLGFEAPTTKPGNPKGNLTPGSQSPRLERKSPDPDRKKIDEAKNFNYSSKKGFKVEAEYKKDRCEGKSVLHMVVIGHVDAGKSTLMGHLLLKMGTVSSKLMHKYEQESKKLGKQSFLYAWILDETGEERCRGITMDVGQNKFETNSKMVTVLDAPGHKDFIPNMITGASQADVALLVVDSTRGEFETGFESGGQTREHALLVRSLGVSQIGVVVNKLDTVGWSEDRFKEICTKLGSFLKQAGFKEKDITFTPCSGLAGINLTEMPPSDCPLLSWYKGPTLIQVIDKFQCPERPVTKPLRMTVNDVYKGTGTGFCISGRVETGFVQQGDKVLVLPQNEIALVKSVIIDDLPVTTSYAGDYASVTLANFDQQNISIGHILCDPASPVPVTTKFEARVVVFNVTHPITKGFPVVLHMQFLSEQAIISKLVCELNKSSGEIKKKRPRCLLKNSSAVVHIETSKPVCLELYRDIKELGRFMLRVSGVTIAAGLITKVLSKEGVAE